jgi:peptidoglycan/LPS O-acetylase OafA/YrhL
MENPKHRIASLDGLRAVSISMVVIGHTMAHSHASGGWASLFHYGFRFARYGAFGVDVFFVISGFLITTLLLKEREKTGAISLRNFYVRRAYRILPASYAVTLAIALLWHNRVQLRDVLCSLLYVQNFNPGVSWSLGHMWSLSVEEQFYLLWPFLLNRFFRQRYSIVITAILAAPLFRGLCGWLGFHHAAVAWFPCTMDALAIGCLLALFKGKAAAWSAATDRWFIPALAGTLAIPQFSYPHGLEPLVMLTLQNLGIAFCIEHCIRKKYWILNWAPITWIGVLSYSIYLCQEPFFQNPPANIFEKFPANLLCILPAAIACHYLIEKPFLRLRESSHRRPNVQIEVEA